MMEFPSSDTVSVRSVLAQCRNDASAIRNEITTLRGKATVDGATTIADVVQFIASIRRRRGRIDAAVQVSGVQAEANEDIGAGAPNLAAKAAVLSTAVDTLITWLVANIPQDGNRYLLAVQLNTDGSTTERTFTAAQLSGLVTRLDALTATIS